MSTARRHAVARVDLGAIRANVAALRARTTAEVLAVVKADGYGHGLVPASDAKGYARQCALNAIAAAAAVAGGVDRLTGVVKLTGFVASVPEFTGQPGVINGASEILGEIFGDAGRHARSAVGVPVLPLDSPVEVEVVFSFE